MSKRTVLKIIVGIILAIQVFVIISLLSGADWVHDLVLYFKKGRICQDMNQDGVDDFCQYWDNDILIRLEWDTNFDGNVDVWQKFQKDGDLFELDSNYDGRVDYQEHTLPDKTARVLIDSDFDGSFDREETIKGFSQ